MDAVGKEKSINDLFGMGEEIDFEVRLELFDYGQTTQQVKSGISTKV
jgi:uncharacterized protein YlaN (UPF0358 family)